MANPLHVFPRTVSLEEGGRLKIRAKCEFSDEYIKNLWVKREFFRIFAGRLRISVFAAICNGSMF